ncbi:chymotrypsin-1-like [Fopius arisanus]|uniref:Chymotrypsin-1-like n=1 Tax=Fopius arisanus TaxID=64838 RepID=A0A9R1TPU8_9HYME|nr:PREDICTED: chymotrypsin-1-like [Fopius arisanus]
MDNMENLKMVSSKGQTLDVVFAVLHDDYDKPYNDNIALIRVAGDIEFNEKIRPVALPTDGHADYNRLGEIVGWFTVKADLSVNNQLQSVNLPIISNDQCAKYRDITDKHICVHDEALGDFCHEDIGAPLIVDDLLVGIESYVAPCAGGLPDVFTRIYSYRQWIDKIIRKFEMQLISLIKFPQIRDNLLLSDKLHEIDLPIISNEECKKDRRGYITEKHVCTYFNSTAGLCFEDIGGPLIFEGAQLGIASYAIPCSLDWPDVYTRISGYLQWIIDHVGTVRTTST